MEVFDEIVSTKTEPGKVAVETEVLSPDLNSRSEAVTDRERLGILWWRALEYLALADSRLKECFCGRDRSPASVRLYHRFRLKMIDGRRYRTDA